MANFEFCTIEPNEGTVPVPDPRLRSGGEIHEGGAFSCYLPSMRPDVMMMALLGGILFAGGCSDDNGGESRITTTQSQAIWTAAYQAVTQVEQQLLPDMEQKNKGTGKGDDLNDGGGDKNPDGGGSDKPDGGGGDKPDGGSDGGKDCPHDGSCGWISGTIDSFQVNGTIQNTAGAGSATIAGNGGKKGNAWGVTLTITFSGWDTGTGIVINGPLTLDYTLTSLVPAESTLQVTGTLQASIGPLVLPASVDVKVEVKGGTTTTCGTVAGNPVGTGPCP